MCGLLVQHTTQSNLPGPSLPHYLINVDRLISTKFLWVCRIWSLNEPLTIEEFGIHRDSPLFRPLVAIGGKLLIAHFQSHLFAGFECGNVKTANPGNHPMPRLVQRGQHGGVQ